MILKQKNGRVVLFGVEESGDWLIADLAYLGGNLINPVIKLESMKEVPKFMVELPESLLNNMFPTKTQQLTLKIVRRLD